MTRPDDLDAYIARYTPEEHEQLAEASRTLDDALLAFVWEIARTEPDEVGYCPYCDLPVPEHIASCPVAKARSLLKGEVER